MWFKDVASALKTEFNPQGYNIIDKEMKIDSCGLSFLGLFIPELKMVSKMWGKTMEM